MQQRQISHCRPGSGTIAADSTGELSSGPRRSKSGAHRGRHSRQAQWAFRVTPRFAHLLTSHTSVPHTSTETAGRAVGNPVHMHTILDWKESVSTEHRSTLPTPRVQQPSRASRTFHVLGTAGKGTSMLKIPKTQRATLQHSST